MSNRPNDTPFQYAFRTRLGFFDYLEQDAKSFNEVDTFMNATHSDRPIFTDNFLVQERLINGFHHELNHSNAMMVDIGGSLGQDLERLKRPFPQASGRFILQDLARTVANASVSEGIESMPYDFFTPKPVGDQHPRFRILAL